MFTGAGIVASGFFVVFIGITAGAVPLVFKYEIISDLVTLSSLPVPGIVSNSAISIPSSPAILLTKGE